MSLLLQRRGVKLYFVVFAELSKVSLAAKASLERCFFCLRSLVVAKMVYSLFLCSFRKERDVTVIVVFILRLLFFDEHPRVLPLCSVLGLLGGRLGDFLFLSRVIADLFVSNGLQE